MLKQNQSQLSVSMFREIIQRKDDISKHTLQMMLCFKKFAK
jgi:hypothetical protein